MKYFDSPCPECGHRMGALDALIQYALNIVGPGEILRIIEEAEKKAVWRCPRCKEKVKKDDPYCPFCFQRFRR